MLNFENSVFTKRRVCCAVLENDRRSYKSRSKYAKSNISTTHISAEWGPFPLNKNLFSQDADGCKEQGSDAGFLPPKEGKPKTSPPPISDRLVFFRTRQFSPKSFIGAIRYLMCANFEFWPDLTCGSRENIRRVLGGFGAKFHQPAGN